jgi:hypothetical protein
MADPTKYTTEYSFSGFQATNPDDPLPAASVDNEFANLENSIDEIVEAIKDVRRSDGALKNGIVTEDSLSADVAAEIGSVASLANREATEAARILNATKPDPFATLLEVKTDEQLHEWVAANLERCGDMISRTGTARNANTWAIGEGRYTASHAARTLHRILTGAAP